MSSLKRAFGAGLISLFFVPLFWSITGFGTPGFLLSAGIFGRESPSFFGNAINAFEIAAILDFVLLYALTWGTCCLRKDTQEAVQREKTGYSRSSTFRSPRVLASVALCAVPLSLYATTPLFWFYRGPGLSYSLFSLAMSLVLSFLILFGLIGGLHALAVRLRRESGAVET